MSSVETSEGICMQTRTLTRGVMVAAVALAACGGAAATPATPVQGQPTCGQQPEGDPRELTTPLGDGTRFGALQLVTGAAGGDSGGYVEVAGKPGGRRAIAFGRDGCMALPEPGSDACPVIEAGTLAHEVWRRLDAAGVSHLNGIGLGVGGEVRDNDLGIWHFGLGVTRWRDADAALAMTATVLDEYDVATAMGVSVRGVDCAVLLEAQ